MTIWGYDRINSLFELGPVYMLYSVVPTQIVHTGGRCHPPYGVIYFLETIITVASTYMVPPN